MPFTAVIETGSRENKNNNMKKETTESRPSIAGQGTLFAFKEEEENNLKDI